VKGVASVVPYRKEAKEGMRGLAGSPTTQGEEKSILWGYGMEASRQRQKLADNDAFTGEGAESRHPIRRAPKNGWGTFRSREGGMGPQFSRIRDGGEKEKGTDRRWLRKSKGACGE